MPNFFGNIPHYGLGLLLILISLLLLPFSIVYLVIVIANNVLVISALEINGKFVRLLKLNLIPIILLIACTNSFFNYYFL